MYKIIIDGYLIDITELTPEEIKIFQNDSNILLIPVKKEG